MAPPRFRSMVFIPRPTAVLSLGSDTEIMFTMGIIIETTPTSETATSIVSSVVVVRLKVKSSRPMMLIDAPRISIGFGPIRVTNLPIRGPTISITSVAGASVNPVEITSSPNPYGGGSLA